MTAKERNELLERGLAEVDPLAEEDVAALAESADPDRLLSTILASPARESDKESRGAAARIFAARWRRPALVAAPVAAAALLALAVGLPGGGGGSEGIPQLAKVAEAAAAQPMPNTNYPFRFVKTRELTLDGTVANHHFWEVFDTATNEQWIANDGSGLLRRHLAMPKWASADDKEAWEAAGRIPFLAYGWKPHSSEERVPKGYFDESVGAMSRLKEMPSDPTELASWLEGLVSDPAEDVGAGNGNPLTVRVLTVVSDLLRNPFVSPEQRAALYEAEGLVPGIEFFGPVTDAAGRPGVAIGTDSAVSGGLTRYLLIFDPNTSEVLATEQIDLKPHSESGPLPGPRTVSTTLYLESRGADSLGG